MTLEITLAYLHFLALIGTASLLVTEMVLCRPGITGDALQRLKKVDGAYGSFAGLTLATGALRLFFGAKGSHYYLANPIFHTKFSLFVLVGLLSILPTVRILGWSKSAAQQPGFAPSGEAIAGVRRWVHIELLLLAFIPLFATLMAHGVSRFGG